MGFGVQVNGQEATPLSHHQMSSTIAHIGKELPEQGIPLLPNKGSGPGQRLGSTTGGAQEDCGNTMRKKLWADYRKTRETTGLPLLDGARALLRCTASKQHTGHVAKRFLLESCGGRFPSQPSFLQPQSAQPIQGQGRLYLRVGSSGFRAAGVVPRVGSDLQHVRTFSSRDLHTADSPPSTPSREYAKVHQPSGP